MNKPERNLAVVLSTLAAMIVVGTAGYTLIERWSTLDALFMTVISLTTVGYGEVHPLSPAGKVFTLLIIFGGVVLVALAVSMGSKIVLEGQLDKVLGRRKVEKHIGKLRDHYIICGYGRMGRVISREFKKKPVPFVVVERDPEIFKSISPDVLAIHGNATEDETLRLAGIERARGLVSVVSSDADNVYITLTATGIRPDLFIVVRAGDEGSEQKLLRAGASKVVSPYTMGGTGMANAVLRPAVVDFIELVTRREHLELQMEEVLIGPASPLAGQTILETGLRQLFGVIVVAVKKRDDHMDFNPPSEYRVEAGDRLIVLGAGHKLADLNRLASAAERG